MSLTSELSSLLDRVANGDLSIDEFAVERTRVLDALWDRPREVIAELIPPPAEVPEAEAPEVTPSKSPAHRSSVLVLVDSPEDTFDWVEQEVLPEAEAVVRATEANSLALRWAPLDQEADDEVTDPGLIQPSAPGPVADPTGPFLPSPTAIPPTTAGPTPATTIVSPTAPAVPRVPWTWGTGGLTLAPGLLLLAAGLFGLLQPIPDGGASGSIQFESSRYVLFFLGVLSTYWLLGGSRKAQKVFLLGASFLFYATYSAGFVVALVAAILANYHFGNRIADSSEQDSKRWLRAGVLANLLLLGVFKYYGFFVESLTGVFAVLGFEAHLPILQIILPIGISFYSFQSIAYLVELRRETGHRAKSLLDFALFLGFFPQLLIGPICRARQLLPQIEAPAPRRVERVPHAISLILGGLFKRMILGSLLFSSGVSEILYTPENFAAPALWVAMIAYTIQIWCDFSGYTDIVRGCAMLMGFEIPDNFSGPYIATSIGDFWRRWHITFSHWLRDFIYFPLGGSHCPRPRAYFNLFMTMFVCGLWHGASWGFIIWGVLHGLALVLYKFNLDRSRDRGIDPKAPQAPLIRIRGWLWTMAVVCFSRIFFVTSDLSAAATYLERMFDFSLPGRGFELILIPVTLIGFALNFWGADLRDRFVAFSEELTLTPRLALWFAAFLVVTSLRPLGVLPNAYFQF